MRDRPSRTNLMHIGIMAAVLIGSVVTVALASGGVGSTRETDYELIVYSGSGHGIRL